MFLSISRLVPVALVLVVSAPSFAQSGNLRLGDEQLAEIGMRWATAINDRDAPALDGLVAFEQLAARSAASATDNESERASFVRGFMGATRARFAENQIAAIENGRGHARYLRVQSFAGMRGALVRYDFESQGTNYLLLLGENVAGAGPRIVDIFVASNGERLSETAGAVALLLVAPSESLLGRVFGLKEIDEGLAATFREIGNLQRQGKVADVYAKLAQLPEPIRNHRVIINMSVQISGLLGEDVYREELARLARYHKNDPTAAFALIDYYFYKGDTQSAMDAILGMESAFGLDAAIAMLKANVVLAAGDFAQARQFAEQAVELEPENEASRWTLLAVLMPAEQYAAGIEVLEGLERDFGYELDAATFADNDVFDGFVKSREYAAWRAGRD